MKTANLIFVSLVTIINVLVATGYSVAGLIDPSLIMPVSSVITDSTNIFAMYAAARTIPIALLAIWAVIKRTRQELFILGILAGSMQFLDGFIGLYQHDLGKTIGPFVLALLQFIALTKMSKKENI
jgi:hypothetical protein